MSIGSGKRKLTEKSTFSSSESVVKQKRTCSQPSSDNGVKTLSEEEYAQLKQYLKEKKKLLKVSKNAERQIVFIFIEK